jgi:metallo-beta-lactamase class B
MPAPICTHPWRFHAEPFQVFGKLFYVGNRAVCMHLIDTGDGLILLDAGYPQTVYLLLESIRQLGFDPQHIRIILNTHAHYDHLGGTRAVAELTRAATYLGKDDVELVISRPELTEAELAGMQFYETYRPNHALSDGDTVCLGSTVVRCVHTPGHTPGAMSYFFQVADGEQAFHAGIHGGPGQETLKDAYLLKHRLPLGLRKDYARALERLRAERVDIHLATHPGQNQTFQRKARLCDDPLAFIDQTCWPGYLDRLEQELRRNFGDTENPTVLAT